MFGVCTRYGSTAVRQSFAASMSWQLLPDWVGQQERCSLIAPLVHNCMLSGRLGSLAEVDPEVSLAVIFSLIGCS